MNNTIENIREQFEKLQAKRKGSSNGLGYLGRSAFNTFNKMGLPAAGHEEWKYTRISNLFNKEYIFPVNQAATALTAEEMQALRLPGNEEANELVFLNGIFNASLSTIRSEELVVMPLEEASHSEYKLIVTEHLGHSAMYLNDGINALNTAFAQAGLFIHVRKGYITEHPVYIYHVADARNGNIFSQPRSLMHVDERAEVKVVETFVTLGTQESLTNQVLEIVVEQDAYVEYYKIENDASPANLVSTTHLRQVGKSLTHAVTVSLDGGIVRNNLNIVLEAPFCESHMYGLYFQKGNNHIDNHTVVDNVAPNCFSNELYKGLMDDRSTGVFNGKIFVRQAAQKTNAYQSNKNILLSDASSVNSKPQLEIFADDVKCSHGCTVGQLDEEAMFYLRSRGVSEATARSLLLHGFAIDVLDKIKLAPIKEYVDGLISKRLEFDFL